MRTSAKSTVFSLLALFVFGWQSNGMAVDGTSAGAIIAIAMPTYGDYQDIASDGDKPGFPTQVVALGGDVSFARRGAVTGGRFLSISTQSQAADAGSYYTLTTMGAYAGGGYNIGGLDFMLTALLGYGVNVFSTADETGAGSVVEVQFLNIEPALSVGAIFGNFRVSLGGSYMYGIPSRVTQYGTAVLDKPESAPLTAIIGMVNISFGTF